MKTTLNGLLGAAAVLLGTLTTMHDAGKGQGGGNGNGDGDQAATARVAFRAAVEDRMSKETTLEIVSMNPDGSDIRQLTRYGGIRPVWSSDQKYIAFYRGGWIRVMDGENGEFKGETSLPIVEASDRGHDWAPDKCEIVFTGTEEVGFGLWLIRFDPVARVVGAPLLLREGVAYGPQFSPDGTQVAFCAGQGLNAKVLDLVSGEERLFEGDQSMQPRWSPRRGEVAFAGVVSYGIQEDPQRCYLEGVIYPPCLRTAWRWFFAATSAGHRRSTSPQSAAAP